MQDVQRVLVIDGDAQTPARLSFVVGPGDWLIVATNNPSLFRSWHGHDVTRRVVQCDVWHVPATTPAADMALAFLAGKLIAKEPRLKRAQWVFHASDRSFLALQPMLELEGVPWDMMAQIECRQIKPACHTKARAVHHAAAVSPKPAKKENKPQKGQSNHRLSALAQIVLAKAVKANGGQNIHPKQMSRWVIQQAQRDADLHRKMTEDIGGEVTIKTVNRWVNHQPFDRKGDHIAA